MEHWRNPASAKRWITHRWCRQYDSQSVMAVLLAATVYAEERDWRQGQAAELFRGMHLLKMKKLPGNMSFPKSGKARRQTIIVSGLLRPLLAQVISERLGVYVRTTPLEAIEWSSLLRPPKKSLAQNPSTVSASLPPRYPRPAYRTLAD